MRFPKQIISILLVTLLLLTTFSINISAVSIHNEPYSTGPNYLAVNPLKKVTFVNYDDQSTLDDYAYLAAIPTTVYNVGDRLISYPLLYYQDRDSHLSEAEQSLNAREGLEYFMDDWTDYTGTLDQITGIGVEKNKLSDWHADTTTTYSYDDPIALANTLALNDWSSSDTAILSVIKTDINHEENSYSNTSTGTFPQSTVMHLATYDLEQTNTLNPIYNEFTVPNGYTYMKAECWWDCLFLAGKAVPTGDPDLHLFCRENGDWMESSAVAQWNIYSPAGHELTYSHVYNTGTWRVGITDFPTEGEAPRKDMLFGLVGLQGNLLQALLGGVTYHVDISLYPGIVQQLNDQVPYGAKDATVKLEWDNTNVQLGFNLIGPGGEVIATANNESLIGHQELSLHHLGELEPNESYRVSIFSTSDVAADVDYSITIDWDEQLSKEEAVSLTNAAEGAVLGSIYNAPLLYTTQKEVSQQTKDTLNKLGVRTVHIVDIDNLLSTDTYTQLGNDFTTHHYICLDEIYSHIHQTTQQNDVIFTTTDPWTTWYVKALEPDEETQAAYHIGPATYLAAHHGSPVIPVEMHPKLSTAITWPTTFWRKYVSTRYEHIPPVADMYYTGMRVYDFLEEHGFDQIGRETLITVAGQYDIGIPWDRIFVGQANPGRFWGTPVDTSYWIARNMFHPALVYTNPAMDDSQPQSYTNGSVSERQGIVGLFKYPYLNSLAITKDVETQRYTYPVQCSFVTHKYRFNERASNYYGDTYQCADGLTPGETATLNPIDQGVMETYTGQSGSYFPDMTESEVIPFYLNRGGYDSVFSTALDDVVFNLNTGVLLWIHASHGLQDDGGKTLFWDPQEGYSGTISGLFAGAKKQENPWRGYDGYFGSTEEPDTMTLDMYGYIPFTSVKSALIPAMGLDWVLATKPLRSAINRIVPFFDLFNTDDTYDGLTGTIHYSKYPLSDKNASQIEENLDGLHNMGFITSICQTSNTYFHLMMIRHGCVFQVQDPWPTSWYGAIWRQSIPRDIILGDTVGEAYTKGMSHVGILYIGDNGDPPQWWWDTAENVVFFGDPNIRMYVPDTSYSEENTWEKPQPIAHDSDLIVDGHCLFGNIDKSYPDEIAPATLFDKLLYVALAVVLLIGLALLSPLIRKRKNASIEQPTNNQKTEKTQPKTQVLTQEKKTQTKTVSASKKTDTNTKIQAKKPAKKSTKKTTKKTTSKKTKTPVKSKKSEKK